MTTVKELIDKLKEFPEDMPVAIDYEVEFDVDVVIRRWIHDNYPYDKPSFNYVCLY